MLPVVVLASVVGGSGVLGVVGAAVVGFGVVVDSDVAVSVVGFAVIIYLIFLIFYNYHLLVFYCP